jgi:hypothetical protein
MDVVEMRSGEAGALSNYFPHKEEAKNNLDLILGVAVAAE